jgi:FdhD protein
MIASRAFDEVNQLAWRGGSPLPSTRAVAEETAIALTYNGSSHAVMMASPTDLEDFAIGFSLTEGVIERATDIVSFELIESELGIEARLWLEENRATSLRARRRAIAGPVGCGLCGIESLEQACPTPRVVTSRASWHARDLLNAMASLAPLQRLNRVTRAMHAAAFYDSADGIRFVREDVGRHNALDKLVGALARSDAAPSEGALLLTSRVSVEMVQKAAMIIVPACIAISAPTTLAIVTAQRAGITLVAVARDDGYEVFTHPNRIIFSEGGEVAA